MLRPLKRRQQGWSIVESMVSVAVVAIVATIGVPQMTTYIDARRVTDSVSDFRTAVALARSEAIRRNQTVRMSALNNDAANEWGRGWRIWIDQNNNGTFEAATDLELQFRQTVNQTLMADSLANMSVIEFSGAGLIRTFTADTATGPTSSFRLCSGESAEMISLRRNGLMTVARSTCT